MKKLIIVSTILLTSLPAIAQSSDNWNYGEYGPEKRERHAQDDEILSNCVNTNKNLYCAESDDGAGIWQINDNQLYNNCPSVGCNRVGTDFYIYSENGELIQVNPNQQEQ
jgi:hypothetical protein